MISLLLYILTLIIVNLYGLYIYKHYDIMKVIGNKFLYFRCNAFYINVLVVVFDIIYHTIDLG